MIVDRNFIGGVAFDAVRSERDWSDGLVNQLRLVGEIFANALTRKQAEEALRKSQMALEAAQARAQLGSWEIYPETQSGIWSKHLYRLYGRDPALGVPTFEEYLELYVHPDDRDRLLEFHARSMECPDPLSIDFRTNPANCPVRQLSDTRHRVPNETGDGFYLAGTVMDITERKRAEEVLRASEKRYRYVFETAAVSLWEYDCSEIKTAIDTLKKRGVKDFGTYFETHPEFVQKAAQMMKAVDANDATLDIYEVESKASLLKASESAMVTEEQFRSFRELLVVIAEGRPYFETELRETTAKGREIDILMSMRIPAEGDPFDRLVLVIQDITKLKQVKDELTKYREYLEGLVQERTSELAEAKERAELADRTKSVFLATMSHELRTPLNSVIGFTGILLQELAGPLTDEQNKQLGMVQSSARHLLDLINDVLDISRIEAGQLEVECEPFDLRQSISKVVEAMRPAAAEKQLSLTFELNDLVGQAMGDRHRAEQVLLNVLNNAIKFTDQGSVAVVVTQVDNSVEISVADTGIGIADDDLDKLFTPFHQLDSGRNRRQEGTGLGLAICELLAKLMGGEIRVESKLGRGSTFTFTLPTDR